MSTYRQERMPKYENWVKWLWRLFIAGFVAVILFFLGLIFFGDIPSTEVLENPKSNLASEVISADGVVLGRFYRQNRVPVRYDELSPHLVNALVATEDERFAEHSGIDAEALGRVLARTVLGGNTSSGGGSTISQQLAKLLFTNPARNIWERIPQKFKEWITAVKIESRYTKKEIISMYLNQFNFINGAYGIKSASEIYFSESQDSLTLNQAALLVGMLKNPALYNPVRFPDKSKKRREVVLFQMKKAGHLTQTQYDSLRVLPLDLDFNRKTHNDGLAPYFREELRSQVKQILEEQRKPDGSKYNVHTDGLVIQTTIDSRMQKHAEEVVWEHFKDLQGKFFKHWKDKDPWTYKTPGKTTDKDVEVRVNALKRMVRESDRFLALRTKHLKKAQELKLRDVDISRMIRIKKEGWKVAENWVKTGFIGRKLANKYKEILESANWGTVKAEWTKLQLEAEIVFKQKKFPMKVFAYNKAGEKDTIMTPYDSIRYHRMFLQTGVMAVDPTTGYIKAWVGGPNYKYFKFDHVNPRVARQVGSTFKPYLYALAINLQGTSPCDRFIDEPVTFEPGTFGLIRPWTPKNSNNRYSGEPYDLKRALKQSKNSISARLMKNLGTVDELRSFVAEMGIDTSRVPQSPTICLGSADLSVYEMTGAYTAFANNGTYTKPSYIISIKDKNGNVLYENVPEQKQVMSAKTAYAMTHLLRGVVAGSSGFGGVKSQAGGKTGTTNFQSDGWFMGITPELVIGTWTGGDDRWVRFRTLRYGQGGRMARPIFANLLKRIEKDKSIPYNANARYAIPSGGDEIITDCTLYDYSNEEEDSDLYSTDSTGVLNIEEEEGDFGDNF